MRKIACLARRAITCLQKIFADGNFARVVNVRAVGAFEARS